MGSPMAPKRCLQGCAPHRAWVTASAFAGGLRIHTHEPLSQVVRQYRSRGWVSEAVSEPEGRAPVPPVDASSSHLGTATHPCPMTAGGRHSGCRGRSPGAQPAHVCRRCRLDVTELLACGQMHSHLTPTSTTRRHTGLRHKHPGQHRNIHTHPASHDNTTDTTEPHTPPCCRRVGAGGLTPRRPRWQRPFGWAL